MIDLNKVKFNLKVRPLQLLLLIGILVAAAITLFMRQRSDR